MRVRFTVMACLVYHARRPGRWSGKPVRIRRGPATVTGEAHRRAALAPPVTEPPRSGPGRRGEVGPEARRPPSDRQAERPRGKGWLHSMKLSLSTGLAAGLLALAAAPALAAPANVTVRVEGATRTLVDTHARHDDRRARQSRTGTTAPGTSAGGALDRATARRLGRRATCDGLGAFRHDDHGRGARPASDYWSLWVNHKARRRARAASELQEGDDVLFFVDRCDVDDTGAPNRRSCRWA